MADERGEWTKVGNWELFRINEHATIEVHPLETVSREGERHVRAHFVRWSVYVGGFAVMVADENTFDEARTKSLKRALSWFTDGAWTISKHIAKGSAPHG